MADSQKVVLAAFVGSCAVIAWRDFKTPVKDAPLPAPPPYRFVWAAVAFGMLGLFGEMVSGKIADVLAGGLFIGLAFQTAQSAKNPAISGSAKQSGPVTGSTPAQ